MRIYVIGLGKLGLPVALTLEKAGHALAGWDVDSQRRRTLHNRSVPEAAYEPQVGTLLKHSHLELIDVMRLAEYKPDMILICVQTPHRPELEGILPLGELATPEDFDYSYLIQAVNEVVQSEVAGDPLVVIVSTCLPGTFEREIRPIAGSLRFAYHPLFIAMSSVVRDFQNPEFVLVGSDDRTMPPELLDIYRHYPAPKRLMSITSAELTKVYYNTWLGYKLMLANTAAELADKVGADVDDVMGTLKCATDRLVSPRYMDAGMGDGGPCHGRDGTALAWLAQKHFLSHDPFGAMMQAREAHARWLADLWGRETNRSKLRPIMLGGAYKAGTPLRTGSHALLVAHYMERRTSLIAEIQEAPFEEYPLACYFLATPHQHFLEAPLRAGSSLVDPWDAWEGPTEADVTVLRPGRRPRSASERLNILH
jgi:UDPglucose 6-dehydrogenase